MTVCHCFAEAVRGGTLQHCLPYVKQWHTLVTNAGRSRPPTVPRSPSAASVFADCVPGVGPSGESPVGSRCHAHACVSMPTLPARRGHGTQLVKMDLVDQ
jgi:hypothetical protein